MPVDLRFVIDTNVVVSAVLMPKSTARQAFDKAQEIGTPVISQDTTLELDNVFRRPGFDKYVLEEERIEFLTGLIREATLVEIVEKVTECRDSNDDKFLELALAAKAACIISGDKDLLVMNPFRGIPILSPRQFLAQEWEVMA